MFDKPAHFAYKGFQIILCALVLAACGASKDSTKSEGADTVDNVMVEYGDCSRSFDTLSKQYLPEMVRFAQFAAARKQILRYGCVDGAPLRSLRFDEIDFSAKPPQISNDQLLERYNQARALGLRKKLVALLRTPPKYPGSGQLEALELAAREPRLHTVAFWTDAISNAAEDGNIATATDAQLRQIIKRWVPRMKGGLQGATVYFLAVGRGSNSTATVRNAEKLFGGVVEGAGGHFVWREDLPDAGSLR